MIERHWLLWSGESILRVRVRLEENMPCAVVYRYDRAGVVRVGQNREVRHTAVRDRERVLRLPRQFVNSLLQVSQLISQEVRRLRTFDRLIRNHYDPLTA